MGRPAGSFASGSFSGWLKTAAVGDTYWTDRPMNGLHSQARYAKRKVTLRQFVVVNVEDAESAKLIRVTVTQ